MTLADYRTADAWQEALALGPALVRITEELPVHEQTGLVMQLHRLMIELPAAVASDLVSGGETRLLAYFKVVAAIELVERIYPALDSGSARQAIEVLATRIQPENFNRPVVITHVSVVDGGGEANDRSLVTTDDDTANQSVSADPQENHNDDLADLAPEIAPAPAVNPVHVPLIPYETPSAAPLSAPTMQVISVPAGQPLNTPTVAPEQAPTFNTPATDAATVYHVQPDSR